MSDKKFNLSTPVNEQDQAVLRRNSKLNEKQKKQEKRLRKAHQSATSKVRTGDDE